MSGAVDNELNRQESKGFEEHIEICGSCRDEYELERLTKAYLRRKITLVDVPYDLQGAILAQISAEDTLGFDMGFFSRIFSNSIFQPVMAVGVVLLVAVALFFANRSNLIMPVSQEESIASIQASGPDVLTMAMNNFQDVLSGKFKPQITATRVADVSTFLHHNAGYTEALPSIPSADWVGGSVANADGGKVTHVVYKIGEGYIYIYSFPRDAISAKHVELPVDCTHAIKDNQWYWGMDQNGDTQVVWGEKNRICVATANLEKKDLISYLKTSDRTVR